MPAAALTVAVNRDRANSIATKTKAFETDSSFAVSLVGHDRPAHVHCRLGGAIGAVAQIDEPNHYVGPDSVTTVPVNVAQPVTEPVEGHLELVTGYGAESVTIDLTVRPTEQAVDVGKTLSKPSRSQRRQSPSQSVLEAAASQLDREPVTVGVLALAGLTVVIGLLTAATVGSLAGLVGLTIVAFGVAVSLWVLFGENDVTN